MNSTFLEYRSKCYLSVYKNMLFTYISEAFKNITAIMRVPRASEQIIRALAMKEMCRGRNVPRGKMSKERNVSGAKCW